MRKARRVSTENYVLSLSEFIERIEFLDLSDSTSTYIFRGQAIKGNLLPSIARSNPGKDTVDLENELLEQLRLIGSSHLEKVNSNNLDLLVVAQHFGLKTRLLDWTTNPLAALWFACQARENGDAYVYFLKADKFLKRDIYELNPFKMRKTCVLRPRLNNERVVSQHGWFTLHRFSNKNGKFVPLEKNSEIKDELTEITVSEKSRGDILNSLDKYGINSRTLFPDLMGLCSYLNWRHDLA